jgi:hypothetical protein
MGLAAGLRLAKPSANEEVLHKWRTKGGSTKVEEKT